MKIQMQENLTSNTETPVTTGRHTSIFSRDNSVDGIRRAESLRSPLVAYTSPTNAIAQLVEFGKLENRYLNYCMLSNTEPPYQGLSGNGERRLADQVRDRPGYERIAVVTTEDTRFGARFFEWFESYSMQQADKKGIQIANVARPKLPPLTEPERVEFEYLFNEAQLALRDLNCCILHPTLPLRGLYYSAEPIDARGGGGALRIADDAPTFELNVNGVSARAIKADEKHFYVLPGSEYRLKANKDLHRGIIKRRMEIEKSGILSPIPGDEERMRLMSLVNLGAPAKAAKTLTGSHLLAKVWRPVPSCPFLYDAG
jgi:hypothetical protein